MGWARRRLAHAAGWLLPLLAFALIVVVWQACCQIFDVPAYLLPSPAAIVTAGSIMPASQWAGHIGATLKVVLLGFALSIAISIPLAMALTQSALLSRTIVPLLVVIHSTPIVAIAPVIVITLGASTLPRIVITCLITFFPLVIASITGLQATPVELIELSRSLRAPPLRQMLQIRLPCAVPFIFSALRVSATLAVIGAVVAEFVAADKGLGYLILISTSLFKVPQAYAALAVLVAISLALFQIVVVLERVLFPWTLPPAP